jgi:hypothetical protein
MLRHDDIRQQHEAMSGSTFVDSIHHDTSKRIICQYWQAVVGTEGYEPGASIVVIVFEFHTEEPTSRFALGGVPLTPFIALSFFGTPPNGWAYIGRAAMSTRR